MSDNHNFSNEDGIFDEGIIMSDEEIMSGEDIMSDEDTMSYEDMFETLDNDLDEALFNINFIDCDKAKEAASQLLGRIVRIQQSHMETHKEPTNESPIIADLEQRIRQNKQDCFHMARAEAKFPQLLRQARSFAEYYSTPDQFFARNGNLNGYEELAEGTEEDLADTLEVSINMKKFAITVLERYQQLRKELKNLIKRLDG